jgi:hypothetical protein
MRRYVIQDTTSRAIKKSLTKWGELPVNTDGLRGVIFIKNYRKYQFRDEVDIEFKGEIFVKINHENRSWYGSDILTKHNISKIKLNRYLRKNALREVQMRMNYFGSNVKDYQDINKVKWV